MPTERAVLAPVLTIGRGGWSLHFPSDPRPGHGQSTLSHYGLTWREHAHEVTDDCVVVSSLEIGACAIVEWAISGPMVNVDLPPNSISRAFGGASEPFVDDGTIRGGARGLDQVSVDVYAKLAQRAGATVMTFAEAMESNYDPQENFDG